jgi:hypothetical protein
MRMRMELELFTETQVERVYQHALRVEHDKRAQTEALIREADKVAAGSWGLFAARRSGASRARRAASSQRGVPPVRESW